MHAGKAVRTIKPLDIQPLLPRGTGESARFLKLLLGDNVIYLANTRSVAHTTLELVHAAVSVGFPTSNVDSTTAVLCV
jgi:hypothetical protein